MRVPRRKGPRPTPSPFDPIVTATEVFHPVRSAANVIGTGVRTVNKLGLPYESFGGDHFLKESDLRADMEARAEEERRARAARQQNRREVASRTHTTSTMWVDDAGVSQPLDKHPNESVCRNLFRRLKGSDLLYPEWRSDRARLTYEITDELGVCPAGNRIDTIAPGDEFNAETVMYVPMKGARRRDLDVFEIEERRVEAQRQRTAATGGSADFGTSE